MPPKSKQWRCGGTEDNMIKKLIGMGKVHKHTKPGWLQREYPAVFEHYNVGVIRNHLNDLKRKCGLMLDDDDDEAALGDVSNLEQVVGQAAEGLDLASSSKSGNDSTTGFNNFVPQNYPILCKTYTDPESEDEKVLMVVSMPGASQNVKVELIDDGQTALVQYSWPKTMFNVEDLFKAQLDIDELTTHHPLVLCFKSGLQETRKRIDFAPVGSFKVSLPIKVQVTSNTWKKWGITRPDGTQVLFATFTGLAKDYILTKTDDIVRFGR